MMVKIGNFNRWQETGLRLARWLVIGFAIFQLILALVGTVMFPGYIQQHAVDFTPNDNWTSEQTQAGLQALGWPAQTMAWIELGSNILAFGISYSLGFILLKRKSQDGFSLFLILTFLIMGSGSVLKPVIVNIPALYNFFHEILGAIGWQLFFIIFFLFPDGKPVPGWSRWIILAWLGLIFLSVLAPNFSESPAIARTLGYALFPFVFSAIGSQVYRQWKHSSGLQKQQTKWVVYSLVIFFIILVPLNSITFRSPSAETIGRDLIIAIVFGFLLTVFLLSILASILIAILRYKLYEIDRIISRTLVYTLLTGMLGLVYFGGVAVLQGILTADGQTLSTTSLSATPPAVVIVVTTLAIAALANPLRRRLQDFIDRRFYRQKYNAEKALADFAAAARSETDLVQLSNRLTKTVNETLQPEKVNLWMRQS